MSPERYPLVIFGGGERYGLEGEARRGVGGKGRQHALDPPTTRGGDREENGDSDACLLNPYDVHCLIGVRPLEEGDGIEGRMRRLLDGPKTASSSFSSSSSSSSSSIPAAQQPIVVEVGQQQPWGGENENASGNTGVSVPTIEDGGTPQVPNGASPWAWMVGSVDGESGVGVGGMWDGVMVGLLFVRRLLWI